MNESKKSQIIEELNKAIKPEINEAGAEDDRVQYHQATHSLEINEEAKFEEEKIEEEKKPDEDEMFESLIRQLNEQKYGFDKRIDRA